MFSGVYEFGPVHVVSGKQAICFDPIEPDQVGAGQANSGSIHISDQECPTQAMSAPTTSAQAECASTNCTQADCDPTDCGQADCGQASAGRAVSNCHEQSYQETRIDEDGVNFAEGTGSFLQNEDMNEGGGNMVGQLA
ncbi:hypothetical protein V6N13_103294 [Hibiscus sabdariffa]